jgi:Zn-dependent metalloprotease
VTRDFYREVYGRNSVDNNGYNLNSYIHFGDGWDNAQWDGTEMCYGDGDGVDFNSFTIAIDVVGHELTHGVTQYTSDLQYNGQSGALNESFSDVQGIQIKQFAEKQTVAKADWLIGVGLFKNGDALRSMKKPGSAFPEDPQPADMDHYVETFEDNGGVHINSGIPNRAFYESCNAFDPNKHSWETIGPAWYRAFTTLHQTASFQDAANATLMHAKQLSQQHAHAVQAGWAAVKITAK